MTALTLTDGGVSQVYDKVCVGPIELLVASRRTTCAYWSHVANFACHSLHGCDVSSRIQVVITAIVPRAQAPSRFLASFEPIQAPKTSLS